MLIPELLSNSYTKVYVTEDELHFEGPSNHVTFYHEQSCCEQVYIADICGELSDLEGSPILMAEVESSEEYRDLRLIGWTFYKFATKKGYVTVRWVGSSNGYYSIGVKYRCKHESN